LLTGFQTGVFRFYAIQGGMECPDFLWASAFGYYFNEALSAMDHSGLLVC
jgi:hypothetical protein